MRGIMTGITPVFTAAVTAVVTLAVTALACNGVPSDSHVAGGTFVGYTFSEQAVVDEAREMEAGYTLTFKAYDLGGDARFVTYVQRRSTGDYYAGVLRIGITDPQGNVYTHYHSAEAEAIDRPIMWTRRVPGVHHVDVEFSVRGEQKTRATFEVPLIREPVSGFLVAGVSLGVLVLVAMTVVLMRKRR